MWETRKAYFLFLLSLKPSVCLQTISGKYLGPKERIKSRKPQRGNGNRVQQAGYLVRNRAERM